MNAENGSVSMPLPGGLRVEDSFLITWLADRDQPCPLCGYNLRALSTPTCPECGNALRLSVALAEPYLKAWIALVCTLLLPAGLGLLWVVMISKGDFPGRRESEYWPPLTYQMAAIPLAVGSIAARRRILRWNARTQKSVAGICGLLALASFIWLGWIIR